MRRSSEARTIPGLEWSTRLNGCERSSCAVTAVAWSTIKVMVVVCVTLSGPAIVTVMVLVPTGVGMAAACVGFEAQPETSVKPARKAMERTSAEIRLSLRLNTPSRNAGMNTRAHSMRALLLPKPLFS